MIRNYKTSEAFELLCMDAHHAPVLEETGLLIGRKVGKGKAYDSEELDAFIRASRGFDVSNDSAIRFNAPMILKQMKKG